MMFHILLLLLFVSLSQSQEEIITNPDFENDFDDDWFCSGSCTLERTDEDSYSGQYSGKVTDRYE